MKLVPFSAYPGHGWAKDRPQVVRQMRIRGRNKPLKGGRLHDIHTTRYHTPQAVFPVRFKISRMGPGS